MTSENTWFAFEMWKSCSAKGTLNPREKQDWYDIFISRRDRNRNQFGLRKKKK